MNSGGVRAKPTPSGVPVAITSPGSKEMPCDQSAMQVATSDDAGPTVRTVLLRGLDERGFMFVTNLESTKSRQLGVNPRCALTLVWPSLSRQVCATGTAERVADDEVVAYWRTRPRGHRLAAWASPQSRVVPDRAWLDAAFAQVEARFDGVDDIPVPAFWGGWRIVPNTIELWEGRTNRLHDRVRFRRAGPADPWIEERLAP